MNTIFIAVAVLVFVFAARRLRNLCLRDARRKYRQATHQFEQQQLANKYYCVLTDEEIANFNMSRWD